MTEKRSLCWILLVFCFHPLDCRAIDYRIFTNKDGVEIKAALVAVREGKVTLKKDNGRTYSFPLETLSDEDKDYVKRWMEENVHVSLDLRFEKEKLSSVKVDQQETSEWIFNVTVTNRGFNALEEVTFKYAIFKDRHDRFAEVKNAVVDAATGKTEATSIPRTKSFAFKTVGMKVQKENSKTYSGMIDGVQQYTYRKWDESLCGITVEVYVKGKLVERKEFGKTAILRGNPDARADDR